MSARPSMEPLASLLPLPPNPELVQQGPLACHYYTQAACLLTEAEGGGGLHAPEVDRSNQCALSCLVALSPWTGVTEKDLDTACQAKVVLRSEKLTIFTLCACMLNHFSHVQLFATLCTVAGQAPLSMGFSRQEYWSELPCLSPGDFPNPGIKHASLMSPALQVCSLPLAPPGKPHLHRCFQMEEFSLGL